MGRPGELLRMKVPLPDSRRSLTPEVSKVRRFQVMSVVAGILGGLALLIGLAVVRWILVMFGTLLFLGALATVLILGFRAWKRQTS